MKILFYEAPVESEEDLVGRIVVTAGEVEDNPAIFRRLRTSLENRCRLCIGQNVRHFEHL